MTFFFIFPFSLSVINFKKKRHVLLPSGSLFHPRTNGYTGCVLSNGVTLISGPSEFWTAPPPSFSLQRNDLSEAFARPPQQRKRQIVVMLASTATLMAKVRKYSEHSLARLRCYRPPWQLQDSDNHRFSYSLLSFPAISGLHTDPRTFLKPSFAVYS